jgi:hypothetical protein
MFTTTRVVPCGPPPSRSIYTANHESLKDTTDIASGLVSNIVARQEEQIDSWFLIAKRSKHIARDPADATARDGVSRAPAERYDQSVVLVAAGSHESGPRTHRHPLSRAP